MLEMTISIKDIKDAYALTDALRGIDCDIDVMTTHRSQVVDAKSFLGILSLDLSSPLYIKAYTDDPDVKEHIADALKGMESGAA